MVRAWRLSGVYEQASNDPSRVASAQRNRVDAHEAAALPERTISLGALTRELAASADATMTPWS
jgi:hypothetical protein